MISLLGMVFTATSPVDEYIVICMNMYSALNYHDCLNVHVGKKEIVDLRVRCSNTGEGCQWEGTVGTLESHVAGCEYSLVPCPKLCEGVEQYMRKDMDAHLQECPNRDYNCQYCGKRATYATIMQTHDTICEKKLLPCLNAECDESIERMYFTEHIRTICPYTVISCKYKSIGCKVQRMREEMEAHEKDDIQLHLQMALDAVNMLHETVTALKSKEESISFAMPDYQKSKSGTKMFKSPPFYTSPDGYHMEVRVHGNGSDQGIGTHISVSIFVLEGGNDHTLKWPFQGKITFQLLNQLEDDNHHEVPLVITSEDNLRVKGNWGLPTFIPHTALVHDSARNIQYLVDDTLYFRVSVEVADHKPWLQCTAK